MAVPETRTEREFDLARTIALSDGVFAIALTLLVLSISVPSLTGPREGEILSALLDRRTEFFSYALSFAVIATFWVRHHELCRALDRVDARLTFLNLVYLGLIAFMPYPTELIGAYGEQWGVVVLYALAIVATISVATLMRRHALHAGLALDSRRRELEARSGAVGLIVPLAFLASVPLAAVFGIDAAVVMWLSASAVRVVLERRHLRAPA